MSKMISLISLEFTGLSICTNAFQKVLLLKLSEFSEFPYGKLDRKHILLRIKRFVHSDFTDFTFIHKCLAVNCFDLVKSTFQNFTVSHCYKGCTIRNMLYRLFTIVAVDMSDTCGTYTNHIYQCISIQVHDLFELNTNYLIAWNRLKTLYNALSVGISGVCVTCMNHVHQRISNQIHSMFDLISDYITRWYMLKTLYIVCPVDTTDIFGICSNTTCRYSVHHLSICPSSISVMREV